MTEKLAFKLVSPDRIIIDESFYMVILPGTDGDLGIMKGHTNLITSLRPGVITIFSDSHTKYKRLFVSGGFADIQNNGCTVLAQDITEIDKMNIDDIHSAIKDIKEDIEDSQDIRNITKFEKMLALSKEKINAIESDFY